MDLSFKHPFCALVSGPTSCGKTVFTLNFIQNIKEMCNVTFKNIIWYYDEWQPSYDNNKLNIKYTQGLPNMRDFTGSDPSLIIIDDLMKEAGGAIVDIFTKGSHHRNLSVFYITQNLFHQGKGQRDISLNAHYIIYFKNPRDKAQISHLARQVCPENSRFIQEAYYDSTSRPHGYLVLDLKQNTPESLRIRTNILPGEYPTIVYVPRKGNKHDSLTEYSINSV
ncbi:unnamed protein product [Brassicogethes aeneus]|uniref:Uncharacterized protein n=1 Tax=Brassicogethes aeneus TaxID=1431903 RepID=A0A9P0FIM7_BRAAE|nr:unnamed protein product [Brassicogethes aeneus]